MTDLFPGVPYSVPEWHWRAREHDSGPWIPDRTLTDSQRLLVEQGWTFKVRCGKLIFQKPDGFWVSEEMALEMAGQKNPEENEAEVVQLDAWRGARWSDPDMER